MTEQELYAQYLKETGQSQDNEAELYQQYLRETGQSAERTDVANEMPAFLSVADRAILKNFSNSPKASLAYLKNKYPDKQFKLEGDEVIARASATEPWGRLDPQPTSVMDFIKDLPQDALDIAYDVPAGVAQGIATTAGAAGGAIAGAPAGGVGAVPGAYIGGALASGASGAALEAGRQGIGKALGIPQELDGGQIATTGAVGLVTPGITGIGKVKGIEKPLTGLAGKAWEYTGAPATKWLQSKATGINKDSIKYFSDNIPDMLKMKNGGVTETAQSSMNKLNEGVKSYENKLGQNVANSIKQAGQEVDITPAKAVYLEAKQKLEQGLFRNDAEASQLKAIVNDFESATSPFFKQGFEVPNSVDPELAMKMQQDLKGSAKFWKGVTNDPTSQAKESAARRSWSGFNEAFSKATDGSSQQAKDAYSGFKRVQDVLPDFDNPENFGDTQKFINTMSNLDNPNKVVLKETIDNMAKDGVVDMRPDIQKLKAWKEFYGNPWTQGLVRKGALTGVGASVGSLAGYQTGGGYSGAAIGGGTGAAIGAALSSPAALSAYLRSTGAINNASQYAKPYLAPSVNQWMLLRSQEEQ
jgi:hypothetical protein